MTTLESFAFGPSLLQATLRQFPKKMWCYQPGEDRRSIHDLVIQLAESEASTFLNCRHLIAEPGSAAVEFDTSRGTRSFVYFNQGVRESLKIISHLRKSTCGLLSALPDRVWDNIVNYPPEGCITLNRWMMIQERRIPICIEQMRSAYNSWIKAHPSGQSAVSLHSVPENAPDSVEKK
jgi:hypothetical protein